MSGADESAIDHLVNETLEGRAAKEAEKAPAGASVAGESAEDDAATSDDTDATDDATPEAPSKKGGKRPRDKVTIGFADGAGPVDEPVAAPDEDDIEQLRAERDGYLADTQRLAADFANFRKQSEKRVADAAAAQSAGLVRDLIPVLDACDSALTQDPDSGVAPIRQALISELEKNGLELLAPSANDAFDPEQHEAVMHEAADGDTDHDGPVVGEVLRAGYLWKGRVVRPAMVKVIG